MTPTLYGHRDCGWTKEQRKVLKRSNVKYKYKQCSGSKSKGCKKASMHGWPTWEVNGKLYPGYRPVSGVKKLVRKVSKSKNRR